MKEIYTTRKRRLEDLEAKEAVVDACDRLKRVQSTNAVLTIHNARQHLHHFCATLPQRTGRPETSPVYLLEATSDDQVSCKVILPASLPAVLQTVSALSSWRTETMAKKDAAFEAYWKLYEAGLVNDHLLPPFVEKSEEVCASRDQDSINEIPIAFNPWMLTRQGLCNREQLYVHRICISGPHSSFPQLAVVTPYKASALQ